VEAKVSPAGVDGVVDGSGVAVFGFFVGHLCAVPGYFAPDERIGVRTSWFRVRRQRDARAVATHVVVVDVDLWPPAGEKQAGHVLTLVH
jgi:hypothetical protein